MRSCALTLCSPPIVILNLSFVATGDGACTYVGDIDSSSDRPPSGTNTWEINCDSSWTDVSITIVNVVTCPVGQEPNTSGDGCNSCPVGEYSDSLSTASCTPCSTGRYNPLSESTSSDACLPCGAGEGSSVGSSVCTPCTPGTFSQGGEDCSQCPAGQYSDDAGAASCPFCGAGKGSAEGSYACTSCIGGYSSGEGDCVLCEGGKYSDVLGATSAASCQACEAGKSSAPGATSSLLCYSVANDQVAFYNSIDWYGNNKMAPGGGCCIRWHLYVWNVP